MSVIGYLSFDLEIYNELEINEETREVENYEELIPSCMAYTIDGKNVSWWWDKPYLSKDKAIRFVYHVRQMMRMGYAPVTWNGTSFDWRVLAYYSGLIEECAEIALFSIDLMMAVTFRKGYYLGLEKALLGAGLETKLHEVTLNDGTLVDDMNGSRAPSLWKNGEYRAVLDYLRLDVIQPYKLTMQIAETAQTVWQSNPSKKFPNGRRMSCPTPLQTVASLFSIKKPDTSWMTGGAPSRKGFVSWMPESVIEKHKVLLDGIEEALNE